MNVQINVNGNAHLYIAWYRDSKIVPVNYEQLNKLQYYFVNHPDECNYVKVSNGWNKQIGNKPKTRVNAFRTFHRVDWTIEQLNSEVIVIFAAVHPYPYKKVTYFRFTSSAKANNGNKVSGMDAINEVMTLFQEKKGISFNSAFGFIDGTIDSELMNDFKAMQVSPMVWTNPRYIGRRIFNYNKADYCSAYPSNGLHLPDYHSAKTIKGKVELEDYPEYDFAFYRKSHHIVERGVFDSREMWKHPWMQRFKCTIVDVKDEDEITVLMKYSEVDMTSTWQDLYERKKTDENAKAAMVAAIGTFQSNAYWCFQKNFRGHLSAVIYYRHENNMLKKIDEIERAGNTIVQLATDSIAWKGQPLPESVDYVKALGNFYSEYERAQACIKSTGNYAIEVDGKVMLVKTQGGASIPEEVKKSLKSCEDILTIRETSGYSDGYELLSYDTGLGFNSFEYKKIALKDFENVMRYF